MDVPCLCSSSSQIKTKPYEAFNSFSLLRNTAASVHIRVSDLSPLLHDPREVQGIFVCVISLPLAPS